MTRNWWGKFVLLALIVVFSGLYVYPTLANIDLTKTKFPFKQKINLGLDLQGGLYMVLGVDFNKVYKDVLQRQASSLVERLRDKGVQVTGSQDVTAGLSADDTHVAIHFNPA